jgi:hypothetical protein
MSVNTKYTDKPNDQYQRANLKGLVGYFHKRWWQLSYAKNYETKIHFPYYPADTSITFRAT